MRLLLLILLLFGPLVKADTIKISFTFQLEQWQGKVVYDNQMPGDLPNPTPDCSIEVYVDEFAVDSKPEDPTWGVYTSPTSHIKIKFGPFEEDHQGAIVEVLSWFQFPGGGYLWGFFFRNKNICSAYGVYRPASQGIYAFYTSTDSTVAPYVVPSDSLAHALTAAGSNAFINGTHAYHNGTSGYPAIPIHAEADNVISKFTAVKIP